jgi:hypothetical protein
MKRHHAGLALICAWSTLACHPAAATVAIGQPVYYIEFVEYLRGQDEPRQVPPATFIVPPAERWGIGVLQYGGEPWMLHLLGRDIQGLPAFLQAGATNGGRTFWAGAATPFRGGPNRDLEGGGAFLNLSQSYVKDSEDATLTYTFNVGSMYLMNYGGAGAGTLSATAAFDIQVLRFAPGMLPEALWSDSQSAALYLGSGNPGNPQDDRWIGETVRWHAESDATYPVWTWNCPACDGPGYGMVEMKLDPYTQQIDLSDVEVGEEFVVVFNLDARANDPLQGETFAEVYIQDPVTPGGGGVGFDFTGLTPTNRGLEIAPVPVPEPETWLTLLFGCSVLGCRLALRRRG